MLRVKWTTDGFLWKRYVSILALPMILYITGFVKRICQPLGWDVAGNLKKDQVDEWVENNSSHRPKKNGI